MKIRRIYFRRIFLVVFGRLYFCLNCTDGIFRRVFRVCLLCGTCLSEGFACVFRLRALHRALSYLAVSALRVFVRVREKYLCGAVRGIRSFSLIVRRTENAFARIRSLIYGGFVKLYGSCTWKNTFILLSDRLHRRGESHVVPVFVALRYEKNSRILCGCF